MTRIAIIGAGASGLSALKYCLEVFAREDVSAELEVCVFEKQSEVGGVWCVIDATTPLRLTRRHDGHGPKTSYSSSDSLGRVQVLGKDVSPMYDGLRTNLPHVSGCNHVSP